MARGLMRASGKTLGAARVHHFEGGRSRYVTRTLQGSRREAEKALARLRLPRVASHLDAQAAAANLLVVAERVDRNVTLTHDSKHSVI